LTGVSCPSSSLCVAVDDAGNAVTSRNPSSGLAAAWIVTAIDTANNEGIRLNAVSCPTGSFCAAVDASGNLLTTTRPTLAAAGTWQRANIDGSDSLMANA